jgi:VIT family protein
VLKPAPETDADPTGTGVDATAQLPAGLSDRVLEPMDRISEVLFGLIMALTFTCTLGVVTAGDFKVRTMLLGALGCNLAWGIIDASVFLMARFNERGRNIMKLWSVRRTADLGMARAIIADALPPLVASVLSQEQLESIRQKLLQLPPPEYPRLTRHDWTGAAGIFLLSFLSTFPIVIPFILVDDARLALRISNTVAVVMLFLCGYAFARHAGLRPWTTGLAMVAVGAVLVAVAILLGG